MKVGQVTITLNPQEFFREKIASALGKQKLTVSEEVEYYLVNLLCDFISPAKLESVLQEQEIAILETPMAVILKKALEAPPQKQWRLYKLLGDTSLYISGYFQDFFNRKTFDVDYYISLGTQAYSSVSLLSRSGQEKAFTEIFLDLSQNFPHLVEVVAEVADLLASSCNLNLLATYDRWTRNQSERLRRKLEDSGLHPIPSNTKIAQ